MNLDAVLSDDAARREAALEAIAAAPEHERSAFAAKLGFVTREIAEALSAADETGVSTSVYVTRLKRACIALSRLRVEIAKSCLLRVADEGSKVVKSTVAHALRETKTSEGRAVLVHLLSDDDARGEAIVAISAEPWAAVLPALIEVAEADEHGARLAAKGIAKCGATSGPKETYAAADFLIELLDDDAVLPAAVDALLRFGRAFPGIADRAQRLAKEPNARRKVAGLCLYAATSNEGNAPLLELALSGQKAEPDVARAFLGPLLKDGDAAVREAAERTWKALDLR